jgi:hypothetical protein
MTSDPQVFRRKHWKPFPVVRLEVTQSGKERFRRWAATFGISRMARALNTDRRIVHTWTQHVQPAIPTPATIQTLIALSMVEPLPDGPLRYEDFYGEVKILSHHLQHTDTGREAPPIPDRTQILGPMIPTGTRRHIATEPRPFFTRRFI